MLRRGWLLLFLIAATLAAARAAEAPLDHYDRVDVAPAKTFVGIASVAMSMPVFTRASGIYVADYRASVVPWIMFNERGRLLVEVSDAQLRALERGETIAIAGRAVRDDGAERRVEGRATPLDRASGRLKIRVYYSKRINLSFETTYRFPGASGGR